MSNNQSKLTQVLNSSYYPWVVWGLAAAFFFFEYFARVSPAVMADQLMRDFRTTGFALGSLSAFFYYAYIPMQIPVGMLVDRYNPRWLLAVMTLLVAFSCLFFSMATSIYFASAARFLMGFGSSFGFITALKLASLWFPPHRFGFLAGLTQALGMLGASVAQAPLAYSVRVMGWRATMLDLAVFFILLAIMIVLLVRNHRSVGVDSTGSVWKSLRNLGRGLWCVLRNPQTWWNGLFVGLLYSPIQTLAELWGVKFLHQTYGVKNEIAAIGIGLIFLGWTFGGPIGGWLSDKMHRRKPMMLASAILSFVLINIILYYPNLSLHHIFILLFLFGLCNTGVGIGYALSSEINSKEVAGTSMAFANMASITLGATFQPLVGKLLDMHWDGLMQNGAPVYTASDFRHALLILPICLLLAVFTMFFIRETHCRITHLGVTAE